MLKQIALICNVGLHRSVTVRWGEGRDSNATVCPSCEGVRVPPYNFFDNYVCELIPEDSHGDPWDFACLNQTVNASGTHIHTEYGDWSGGARVRLRRRAMRWGGEESNAVGRSSTVSRVGAALCSIAAMLPSRFSPPVCCV